ncbi:MAG: hypothetical protein R3E01_25575 [Pirellulaceae bacterium]|nr:hypothetical protein [Planctomycetales bacterium]
MEPKYSDIGESVLVTLAQSRNLGAFQELVSRYQARLTYYIRRLIGRTHETEDVIQELWIIVQVWKRDEAICKLPCFKNYSVKLLNCEVKIRHRSNTTKLYLPHVELPPQLKSRPTDCSPNRLGRSARKRHSYSE